VADIFQEVDEDLRRDKALVFWKKYQNHIIAFVLVVIAGTAGISGWRAYHQHQIEANGTAYLQAMAALERDPKAAGPQFDALANGGSGFAVLARQKLCELVVIALRQFEELHHHARAALRIGVGPLDLGVPGVLDGGANLGLGGQRHLGLDVAGHRLENVGRPPGRALDLFAADEMSD